MNSTLIIVVDTGIHGKNPIGGGQLARLELIKYLKSKLNGRFVFITNRKELAVLAQEIYDETLIVDYVFIVKRRDHFRYKLKNVLGSLGLLLKSSKVLKRAVDELIEKYGCSRAIVFPNENYSRITFSLIKLRGWEKYSGIMVIDNYFKRFKIDKILIILYKITFNKLIATSKAAALPFGNGSSKKVTLIYPGIDIEKIEKSIKENLGYRISEEGRFSIALVGSLLDIKRPDFALEILYRLLHIEKLLVTMHVIGDGILLNSLKETTKYLNLTEGKDVIFWQHMEHSEMFKALKQVDVLLHVSTTESFGRVVVEAQSIGKPVVVARTVSSPEIVEDGVTGFLIDKNDINEFVEKLKTLAINRQLRLKMGENASLFAKQFDTKFTADKYANIFQKQFGVELR